MTLPNQIGWDDTNDAGFAGNPFAVDAAYAFTVPVNTTVTHAEFVDAGGGASFAGTHRVGVAAALATPATVAFMAYADIAYPGTTGGVRFRVALSAPVVLTAGVTYYVVGIRLTGANQNVSGQDSFSFPPLSADTATAGYGRYTTGGGTSWGGPLTAWRLGIGLYASGGGGGLTVTASPSLTTTAADGSLLTGVRISASGITPDQDHRILRWWRQNRSGEWLQVAGIIDGQTATTEGYQDWTCPSGPLDPDNPSTPYSYGVSVRNTTTGAFTFASGVLTTPGHLARPGDLPWLIHPLSPERSLPVTLESDTERRRAALGAVLQPYGVRSPVVTTTGARALRAGSLNLNVPRDLRFPLWELLNDGRPLYLAQLCGDQETDDGLMYLENPSDDVVLRSVCRVASTYQLVYPGRVSPPSILAGSDLEWWQ